MIREIRRGQRLLPQLLLLLLLYWNVAVVWAWLEDCAEMCHAIPLLVDIQAAVDDE